MPDISDFSLQQLAGQRLMVGFDGYHFTEDLKDLIGILKVAGLVLFARNCSAPDQIDRLCRDCQQFAAECGQPPLIIAIDQEGGQVARLKAPFTQFPGNSKMQNTEDARQFAEITARELKSIGINMNFAPVLDLAPTHIESIMVERAFGDDPNWVINLGTTIIDYLQNNGIMSVAKHFPGIGRTTLDSHQDLPVLEVSRDALESYDLVPFKAAITHQVAGIMLSHIRYTAIDADWPASLSTPVTKELLRNQMGYKGLILTDDLDMGAITKHYDLKSAVQQILAADVDIALICHRSSKMEQAWEEMIHQMENHAVRQHQGRQSVERVLKLKQTYLSDSTA